MHLYIPKWTLWLVGIAAIVLFEYFNLTTPPTNIYADDTPVPTPTLLPTPTPNITHGGTRVIPDLHYSTTVHQGGFTAITFRTTPHTRCLAREYYAATNQEVTGELDVHGDSGNLGVCNVGWAIGENAPVGSYRIELIAQTLDDTEQASVLFFVEPAAHLS